MAIAQNLPGTNADGAGSPARADQYLGAYVSPITGKEWLSADEGSYFTAVSPTPGTGIIGHAAPTTFDEAKPYLVLYNGGSKRIYPQFLRLHETVASVGGVIVQLTITSDVGNRRASAGTAMTVSKARLAGGVSSGAVVYQ